MTLLGQVDGSVSGRLEPALSYYGAKCMGYPAVWFVQEYFDLSPQHTMELIENSDACLMVSLSTSIADDFLDCPGKLGNEEMMVFYLFMLKALGHPSWERSGVLQGLRDRMLELMQWFLQHNLGSEERNTADRLGLESKRRIGVFFEAIALEMGAELCASERERAEFVRLAGRFGDWCSELDDFIDLDNDITERQPTRMARYALDAEPRLRDCIGQSDSAHCLYLLEESDIFSALTHQLTDDLNSLQTALPRTRRARSSLACAAERLPKMLSQIRLDKVTTRQI